MPAPQSTIPASLIEMKGAVPNYKATAEALYEKNLALENECDAWATKFAKADNFAKSEYTRLQADHDSVVEEFNTHLERLHTSTFPARLKFLFSGKI